MKIDLNKVYKQSDDLVSKNIEGELVIVPLNAGMGDLNSDLFSLNRTGVAVWKRLDGLKSLKEIIDSTANEYQIESKQIEPEVIELIRQLLDQNLIIAT